MLYFIRHLYEGTCIFSVQNEINIIHKQIQAVSVLSFDTHLHHILQKYRNDATAQN